MMQTPPVADPAPPHAAPPTTRGMASARLRSGEGRGSCIKCAYALHGLPEDGNCPECGTSVEHSRFGVLLRSAGADHLKRLQLGALLIMTGNLLLMGVWILVMIGGTLEEWGVATIEPFAGFIGLSMPVFAIVAMIGWWLFTSPDPRRIETETASRARRAVRVTIVVQASMILGTIAVFTLAVVTASGAGIAAMFLLPFVFVLVWLAATVVRFFTAVAYIRWLGVRLPSETVAKRAGLVVWLAPVLATVGTLILLGPVIALGVYLSLIDMVRRQIKASQATLAEC